MSDRDLKAIVIDGITVEQADAIQAVLSDGEEEGHLDFAFNTFCVGSSGDVMQRLYPTPSLRLMRLNSDESEVTT